MPSEEACGGPVIALIAPVSRPSDTGFGGGSAGGRGAQRAGDVFPGLSAAVRALFGFHRGSLTRVLATGRRCRALPWRSAPGIVPGAAGSRSLRCPLAAASAAIRAAHNGRDRSAPRGLQLYALIRDVGAAERSFSRLSGAPPAWRIRRCPARAGRPSRRPPGPSAQTTAGCGRRGALASDLLREAVTAGRVIRVPAAEVTGRRNGGTRAGQRDAGKSRPADGPACVRAVLISGCAPSPWRISWRSPKTCLSARVCVARSTRGGRYA
jgi:hypothetical protein